MAITVSMWSGKTGDIKKFLDKYYGKDGKIDEDVDKWIYVYNKPLEAIDIISAVMDNNDKYSICLCIQVDDGDIHPVTYENHNDIIKGILYLFYEEIPEVI